MAVARGGDDDTVTLQNEDLYARAGRPRSRRRCLRDDRDRVAFSSLILLILLSRLCLAPMRSSLYRVYLMYIHGFSFPLSLLHFLACVPRVRGFSEPHCWCLPHREERASLSLNKPAETSALHGPLFAMH
jgi:hypothetical protein